MENELILEMKNITKKFGGVIALNDVNFEVYRNEILALVGDNGAGKSTLSKVISGAVIPDGGTIIFEGNEVIIRNPDDAANLGIQMVYQDLALVECLDVADNLFLGREPLEKILGGLINVVSLFEMREKTRQILQDLGIELQSVTQKVRYLSGGQRQAIAIGRGAYWGTKLVIMDEPTAALGVRESQKCLTLIKRLKEKGVTIIIISHNLQQVLSIADRVIVLRQGRRVGDRLTKQTSGDEIVKMITGLEFAGSNRE